MKTIFATVVTLITLLLLQSNVNAQCVGPDLKFANPTLVSGTALSEGAIYKFADITPGIDCYIKLVKFNGGATLVSMETPGMGYGDAWQPIINGPGTPTGNKSWIDWNISFKTTAGANYAFPCLDITAIDVDGDSQTVGEFIQSDGHTSYTMPSPTLLTLTDLGNGRLEAQAPITNRTGIDTMAMDVRIGFLYNGMDSVQLSLGSTVLNNPGGATQRLNCIYFKRMTLTNYSVLPVKYVSFKAAAIHRGVELKWVADNEVNESYFDVERSFDGNKFISTGIIVKGSNNGINNNYQVSDVDGALAGKTVVYYRLKEVDISGLIAYSKVEMVKLQANKGITMLASPNPFTENLDIHFTALQNGSGVIKMQNVTGQCVITKNIIISKGQNTFQLSGMGRLPKGVYVAQVSVNGVIADNIKIMK
jgi:hypothetical protein